jgi:hypothetical protein
LGWINSEVHHSFHIYLYFNKNQSIDNKTKSTKMKIERSLGTPFEKHFTGEKIGRYGITSLKTNLGDHRDSSKMFLQ